MAKDPNHNKQFGKLGEDIATGFLQKKGYKLLVRNFTYNKTEIDIICQQGDEIVFIEVKTRGKAMLEFPEKAVGPSKQRNIRLAAEAYLEQHNLLKPARFDIIAICIGDQTEIEHFEDAFYPFDVI